MNYGRAAIGECAVVLMGVGFVHCLLAWSDTHVINWTKALLHNLVIIYCGRWLIVSTICLLCPTIASGNPCIETQFGANAVMAALESRSLLEIARALLTDGLSMLFSMLELPQQHINTCSVSQRKLQNWFDKTNYNALTLKCNDIHWVKVIIN